MLLVETDAVPISFLTWAWGFSCLLLLVPVPSIELRLLSVISETLELVLSKDIFLPPGPSPSFPASSSLDESVLEGDFCFSRVFRGFLLEISGDVDTLFASSAA